MHSILRANWHHKLVDLSNFVIPGAKFKALHQQRKDNPCFKERQVLSKAISWPVDKGQEGKRVIRLIEPFRLELEWLWPVLGVLVNSL